MQTSDESDTALELADKNSNEVLKTPIAAAIAGAQDSIVGDDLTEVSTQIEALVDGYLAHKDAQARGEAIAASLFFSPEPSTLFAKNKAANDVDSVCSPPLHYQ